jgi:uncharacterized membrane protein
MPRRLELSPAGWAALTLGLLYFVGFGVLSLLRYAGYHSRSFDLAIVVRMLWGIRHGDFTEVFTGQPWIAYHFEPILLPVAAIDALLPVPWLLLLQTGALAAAAVPAWRLGRRALGSDLGGAVGVLTLLLYPVMGHVNVFEMHPVALAIAPALWLCDALDRGALRSAVAAAALTVACREDGFLVVSLALVSVGPLTRRRAALAVLALAAYATYAFIITARLGGLGSVKIHFGQWGGTPLEIFAGILSHPGAVLAHLFSPQKREFLLALLVPLAFLPLLAPRRALPALGPLGLCLLSGLPGAARIVDSHYPALVVPGLVTAALFGAARLARWAGRPAAMGALAAAALIGAGIWGAAPAMRGYQPGLYSLDDRSAVLDAMVASVPGEARVSAPIDVVAHLARRRWLHVFPGGLAEADAIIVDLASRPLKGLSPEQTRSYLAAQVDRAVAVGFRIADQEDDLMLLLRRD